MRPLSFLPIILSVTGILSLSASDADLRFYTREIVIRNADTEGELRPCALFDNKDFAFSARWDDSHRSHYRMQELMTKYGFKGTFFLNHKPDQAPMNFQKLKDLNTDLGAHSMTHARIASEININRMFWEVAEIRAVVEAEGDRPVNSYCFSDGNYRNEIRKHMQGLIAESLQRVGYIHNVSPEFARKLPEGLDPVSSTHYCTAGDNRNPSPETFDKQLQDRMANPEWMEEEPCLSIGVHVWMSNDRTWNAMEEVYRKHAGMENWWYCTQSEYAAYRKILRQYKISPPQPRGKDIVYTLHMPYAADIGSDVALTLRYSGTGNAIEIDGEPVKTRTDNSGTLFHVSPPDFAKTPKVISYQPMSKEDAPQLTQPPLETAVQASLTLSNDHNLTLTLDAGADSKIENLRVRYILPPKYEMPRALSPAAPAPGESLQLSQKLTVAESGEFLWGKPFLLCQIDYLNHGRPERVFSSMFEATVLPPKNDKYRDNSYASSFFTDRSIWEKALPMSQPGTEKLPSLQWFAASDAERSIFNENISDMGTRLNEELKNRTEETTYFMIVTDIKCDKAGRLMTRSFKNTRELYLNGQKLSPKNGDQLMVKEGLNRLVFLSEVNKFTGRMHHAFTYYVRAQ